MKKILALIFWLVTFCAFGQEGYYSTLLSISDNVPVPNQVTGRTVHVPFTDGANDWQGRYFPVKLRNGNIVAVWIECNQHSDLTDVLVNIHHSDDDGATWSDNNEDLTGSPITGFPLDAGADVYGDPQLILCPNDDLLLIMARGGTYPGSWNGASLTTEQWRSTDDGVTWAFDQDFSDAVGIDNDNVHAVYQNMIIGDRVYIIFCEVRTDINDTRIRLFKSDDNGATWDFVSNPVEYDEASPDVTESSVANLGGNRWQFIFRTQNLGNAVAKETLNGGTSYTSLVDFSPNIGYVGIHQPQVKAQTDFFIISGRDNKGNNSYHARNGFWTSATLFTTPSRRQWLDPYYEGIAGNDDNDGDSGYSKFILKDDGSFMFFGYYGDNFAARIYRYDVSNTPTASNEQYNNTPLNGFDVSTITTAGVRLQMNRDNVYAPTPTLTLPQVVTRFHQDNNFVTTPAVWVGAGSPAPEFTVENNEGWAILNATSSTERIHSNETALGADLVNNTFTVSFWLRPDDGQPTATERIFSIVKTNSTSLPNDACFIQLNTNGTMTFRYAEDNAAISSTFATNAAVFPNGATTAKHITWTVTSGGIQLVYVDGVSVANDGVNTGSMVGINMANFTNATNILIGVRGNGVNFDLPYHGLIREFTVLKDIATNSTQVGNIMQN